MTIKRKLAVFDIDDTFYSLIEPIHYALKMATGKDIHPDKWHTFMLGEVYGIPIEEVFQAFHDYDILLHGVVDHEIKPLLKHFKEQDFDNLALSSRGWHLDALRLTNEMLDNNGIVFDHVQIVTHAQTKGSVLRDQWSKNYQIEFFIDDYEKNIHTVSEAIGGNPLIIVKNRPWNKNVEFDDKFKRVENLSEVIGHYENHLNQKNLSNDSKIILPESGNRKIIKPH